MTKEYLPACAVTFESIPKRKDIIHDGWGRPGSYGITPYLLVQGHNAYFAGTDPENVRFRRALLDTVLEMGQHHLCILPSTFIRSL